MCFCLRRYILERSRTRRDGFSLVGALVTLMFFTLVMPLVFQEILLSALVREQLQRSDDLLYGAQYWFNKLEASVNASGYNNLDDLKAALAAMPDSTRNGRVHFEAQLLCQGGNPGIAKIKLTISDSYLQSAEHNMQVTRKFVFF